MKLAKLNNEPEIFYTIQGEGKNLGKPSIFIRTSLCNLHCIWCDTPYTWNWEKSPFEHQESRKYKKQEQLVELSAEQIADTLKKYDCRHVVLTGGEPMMQQGELVHLVNHLRQIDPSYTFEIETNGTICPSDDFHEHIDQFNVSPKLANSNNPERIRIKPKVLRFFGQSEKTNFKFVVTSPEDLTEILTLIENYGISPEKVFLMPEGTSSEVLQQRMPMLFETCMKYGFNLTQRLHVTLFGNKRGV